jgi:hypothetical protein
MSCDGKINSFFSKAQSFKADISYAMYKELQFGNTEKAAKYEKNLQDIKSISWLLKKHEYSACNCNPSSCLCSGAASDWNVEGEELLDDVLSNPNAPIFSNLWKGVTYNSKLGKNVSLVTFSDGLSFTHTGIKIYSWEKNVPTLIYEEDNVLDIFQGSYVSFYYSELHDSYYLKAGTSTGDTMLPAVFKVPGAFNGPTLALAIGAKSNLPTDAIMEVADSLNLLFIRVDANTIEAVSLVDLLSFKTITTTGFPYQKMTWHSGECNLILTGNNNGSALIHYVDVNAGTVTNKLTDPALSNNTSVVMNDGHLLVLTTSQIPPGNTIQFQKWTACCDGVLVESIDTGIFMGALTADFDNILTLAEDKDGNIYVTYVSGTLSGSVTSLSVFNKDFVLKYTKQLPATAGDNFGLQSEKFVPNWTNNNINPAETSILLLPNHRNGVGGDGSYFLDYKIADLVRIKPKCVELTKEEVNFMVNKLTAMKAPKKYSGVSSSSINVVNPCTGLYTFTQATPSVLWTINHNLKTFPVIIAVDSQGNKITGLETYVDKNTVTILFSIPVAGVAYLTYNIK